MSQRTRNTENEVVEDVLEVDILKRKKQKHNSKRRRSKKKQVSIGSKNNANNSKINEVVNFLCSAILKNESETSVDINVPVKIAKESMTSFDVCEHQNNEPECGTLSPSTSAADLSNLFENLQVHTLNNPIKSNNITEFLNIGLLKKTNCESLSIKDLDKLKPTRVEKNSHKEEKDISDGEFKQYFNLDLIQKCPEQSVISQIDSGSTHLVSELQQTFYSGLSEAENNVTQNKILSDYFNVDAILKANDNLLTSIKSTSKLLVSELEKTLLEEKSTKSQKKKSSSKNKCANKVSEESAVFDGSQKVFLNSKLHQSNESTSDELPGSPQPHKNRKRQRSSKNSGSPALYNCTQFPKYLTPEELQSVSNFGVLLSGIIRINQKNYKEAYITAPDKGMDILIEGLRDRNRALEGDEVYFVLKPKEHYRPRMDSTDFQRTAVVVGIKTLNHNRGAIGTLNVVKNKNINFALFSPRDSRLPRIRIKKSNWPSGFLENSNGFKDRLYFAKISQWSDLRFADGELVKEVGLAGDINAETNALLLKYDLDVTPYTDALQQYLPPLNYRISESELSTREDFRKECVFTIDPETAVDLDDALSCKKLPNGNYEVGVHISDVSFFLTEGTPLDFAVSKRATTVYLVQKAYHMLPHMLCRLCSLTPGEDKLSFSVMWEVTPDCKIIGHRFARTVINSCAQLSYGLVQSIIDNSSSKELKFPKIHGGHSIKKIKQTVLFLHNLATNLNYQRFKNGAFKIDQKKIYFTLDENGWPVEYKVEVREQSHQLIEEFMLLANITVAKKLNDCFPKIAFLRSHSPPLQYVLEKLQRSLEKYGIILDISTSGSLYSSLIKYSGDDVESVARLLVLNCLIAKPMARAKYYCSSMYPDEADRWHYALNVPLYTHFTSPIRRYADVMTHRLLAASLGYTKPPNWSVDFLQRIAENCNKKKYAAKMAGEMSTELYLSVYIGLRGVVVCEAVVCDIKDKSFDCIVLSTGAHQRLYFEHIKAEVNLEKENELMRLILKWPRNEKYESETLQIIEMFTIVKIELRRANVLKIEANLLRYE